MTATSVMKSKADCIARDKILFSKLLDVSDLCETFMYAITSHKKQKATYVREMLSHIAKKAILVKRSSHTVDTDNQTFNCDNADRHSQTGNRKNIGE